MFCSIIYAIVSYLWLGLRLSAVGSK